MCGVYQTVNGVHYRERPFYQCKSVSSILCTDCTVDKCSLLQSLCVCCLFYAKCMFVLRIFCMAWMLFLFWTLHCVGCVLFLILWNVFSLLCDSVWCGHFVQYIFTWPVWCFCCFDWTLCCNFSHFVKCIFFIVWCGKRPF